jgi:hypothetical protein
MQSAGMCISIDARLIQPVVRKNGIYSLAKERRPDCLA